MQPGSSRPLESKVSRVIAVRMSDGDDILKRVKEVSEGMGIKTAFFTAIGAVSEITVAVYSPEKGAYQPIKKKGLFEIASCIGNVTTLVDDDGGLWGSSSTPTQPSQTTTVACTVATSSMGQASGG